MTGEEKPAARIRGRAQDSPTSHGLQDSCASALGWEVKLFADVVSLLDKLQDLQ